MNPNNPFGSNISTDGLEQGGDVLGGGFIVDSGVYDSTVKLAYISKSDSGAQALNFEFDLSNGRKYKETIYVTSGDAKGNKNYYEKNGKKSPLPGFTTVNDICLLSTGLDLANQDFEEKVVSIYDFDAKGEVPKKVQVATSLLGKPVTLAILRNIEDKNVKNDAGVYVPGGETRETNTIDKAFHTDTGRTVSEVMNKLAAGEFKDKWIEKNAGQIRNKAKGAAGASGSPAGGTAAGAAGAAAKSKSLFG